MIEDKKIILTKNLIDEKGEPFLVLNENQFFFDVKDNSMNQDLMNEGDSVIIEYTKNARVGDIVLYKDLDGKLLIRILYLNKATNKFYLKASNEEKKDNGDKIYKDIIIDGDIEIYGVIKRVIKNLV